jgi:hypothetical protein
VKSRAIWLYHQFRLKIAIDNVYTEHGWGKQWKMKRTREEREEGIGEISNRHALGVVEDKGETQEKSNI